MIYDLFLIVLLALLLDRALGDPPTRWHPTVWIGRWIELLRVRAFGGKRMRTAYGAFIYAAVVLPFALAAYLIFTALGGHPLLAVLLGGLVLKLQFAWRSMADYTEPIARLVGEGRIEEARALLPYIVGRDPRNLDGKQVISAAVESIGENSVDGIISPLFYYFLAGGILGVPAGMAAAVAFRASSTLDSMIGYKKEGYLEIGFFSARTDDLLNYVPARLTVALIVLASLLLREDWRGAIAIFVRDRRKTPSPNSGHAMAAVAGALGVELEKPKYYRLGDAREALSPAHVARSLRLISASVILFVLIAFGLYEVRIWL